MTCCGVDGLLTPVEVRTAANIAKLPELLRGSGARPLAQAARAPRRRSERLLIGGLERARMAMRPAS